ncbi:cytochrome c oxidase assembly protein [Microlunatus antarcticus]|uniref:Cytochrome c oxidase assembly factor CtaG n=1 Tax=Microlunatus antarcticus TaxID=53388 RepID=A0A7W5JST8_9ACTN|nr:cytochrome c oxidase assembly protein [Microlunatus antarcticus]MBB3325600.1 cytochrome c oxidase assembly factor CtaG [Microlunatus antarcticus]
MPPAETFFSTWRIDPVAAVALALVLLAYVAGVRRVRRTGGTWPVRRTLGFVLAGLGSYAVISFGFLGARSEDLRWAFTTRVALLLLVVPLLTLLGRPLDLAYAALPPGGAAGVRTFLGSRPVRLLGNAIVAPVVGCAVFCVFLTPLAGAWRTSALAEEGTGLVLPVLGLLFVLPIAAHTGLRSEVFIAAEFAFAFVELVLDAIPGLVLRLTGHVLDGVGAVVGTRPGWFPSPLTDQHWSGDVLWSIAEVADLPILLLLFVRWVRSDARHADRADGLTEAELDDLVQAHLRGGR